MLRSPAAGVGGQRRWVSAAALAGVLAAALLFALVAAAPARSTAYGDGAAIPFLLLPADNPWNTPVDSLPLDADSAAYIAHMSPSTGLHPDFGTVWEGARIGMPYIVVAGTQPKVPIHFTAYGAESDPGPYPVPSDAPVEGAGGSYADGDRHVLVLDADGQKLYELYHAYRRADGSWNADSGAVFDLATNALRPDGWTSADAAGLPILPGLARYDEIVGEGVLDHALRFTVADTQRACVYPATHFASDSEDPDLPPMGLRVRLRADFDVGGFPPLVQTILRGLKKYGMMVADNGADWYVSGAPDSRWDDEALHTLDGVTGGDFEVVDSRALLPGAFYVSLPATASAREGVRWTRPGGFFDGAGASWSATVDYARGRRRRDAATHRRCGSERRFLAEPHLAGRRAPHRAGRCGERDGAHGVCDRCRHRAQRRSEGGRRPGREGPPRRAPHAEVLVPRSGCGRLEGVGQLRRRDAAAGAAPPRRQDVPAVTPFRGAARPPLYRHAVRDGRRRRPRRRSLPRDGPLTTARAWAAPPVAPLRRRRARCTR